MFYKKFITWVNLAIMAIYTIPVTYSIWFIDLFSPFSKLMSAYLSHNQITALTIGSELENLRSLYLESNNLNSLPNNMAK